MPRIGPLATWRDSPLALVRDVMARTGAALLFALVACLTVRYLAGALVPPRPPAVILAGVACAAGLAALVRWLVIPSGSWQRERRLAVAVLPALGLGAFAWVWTGEAPVGVAIAAWALVLLEEAVSQGLIFRPSRGWSEPFRLARTSGSVSNGETVLQDLTRTRNSNGVETIRGTLRVEFATGQQVADVHVAFCPPLEAIPTLSVTPTDGLPAGLRVASLRVAECQVYGSRIEVRLAASPAQATGVVFRIHAIAEPPSNLLQEPRHG